MRNANQPRTPNLQPPPPRLPADPAPALDLLLFYQPAAGTANTFQSVFNTFYLHQFQPLTTRRLCVSCEKNNRREGCLTMNRIVGKLAGTDLVHEISFDGSIQTVDELISHPQVAEYIAPGLIDVQVNGFAGVDYNDPSSSHEEIARSIRVQFQTGVTRIFPTVVTGSEQRICGALRNLVSAKHEFARASMSEAAAIEAFHVEGPHISPEDGPRGAHPVEFVRPPDVEEFKRWQDAAEGLVRLVTVSPEWPDTPNYVRALTGMGVVVSIGHTKATGEQIRAAVDAGATMSTHLGNGAHTVLHKTDSYIWHQLAEDRLSPSFILDDIHIPAVFFKTALRAKGVAHSVLVTDAVMPAMCKPGFYRLGSVEVELKQGNRVVLRTENRLAGSALRFDDAIGNAVRMGAISLRDALTMATVNPARVCRITGRQRGVAPGERADFIRFKWDREQHRLTIIETVVDGRTVYSAD
jgi:N-acetylglucosamine-6-phosphate deacetylase